MFSIVPSLSAKGTRVTGRVLFRKGKYTTAKYRRIVVGCLGWILASGPRESGRDEYGRDEYGREPQGRVWQGAPETSIAESPRDSGSDDHYMDDDGRETQGREYYFYTHRIAH